MAYFINLFKAYYNSVNLNYLAKQVVKKCGYSNLSRGIHNYIFSKSTHLKFGGFCYGDVVINKAVTQGSPLSSSLFAIYIDDLINNLEQGLEGVHLPRLNVSIKLLVYADDILIFCKNNQEIEFVNNTFQYFESITGTKMSASKSSVIRMINNTPVKSYSSIIPKSYLGIPFPFWGKDMKTSLQNSLLTKIEKICENVQFKTLTISLRIKIVNYYVFPKLIYFMPHVSFTNKFINKVISISNKIIWPGKKLILISRIKLCSSQKNGGLGLIDIRGLFISVKANAYCNFFYFCAKINAKITFDPTDTPPPKELSKGDIMNCYIAYTDILDLIDTNQMNGIHYKLYKKAIFTESNDISLSRFVKKSISFLSSTLSLPYIQDFSFRVLNKGLPTSAVLTTKFKLNIEQTCQFCDMIEDVDHLFFQCKYLEVLRIWINSLSSLKFSDIKNMEVFYQKTIKDKYIFRFHISILAFIWKFRNMSKFKNISIAPVVFLKEQLKMLFKRDKDFLDDDLNELMWNSITLNHWNLVFLRTA